MSMTVGEAVAAQTLITWLTSLDTWQGRLDSPPDGDVIDAVHVLRDASHKRLGAGPSTLEVMGGLMRVFPR